jgi:hypothetical protein
MPTAATARMTSVASCLHRESGHSNSYNNRQQREKSFHKTCLVKIPDHTPAHWRLQARLRRTRLIRVQRWP